MNYLIWSFEHGGWWGPARIGYYVKRADAGIYDREDAMAICKRANVITINEALVPITPHMGEDIIPGGKRRGDAVPAVAIVLPPAGTPVDQKFYNEACRKIMELKAELQRRDECIQRGLRLWPAPLARGAFEQALKEPITDHQER